VGASLLAIAVWQPTKMLNVSPSSRAGSLPQVFVSPANLGSAADPVGAGLPAKAVGQQHGGWICRRHREQARSHRFLCRPQTCGPPPTLWGRVYPRKRWVSNMEVGFADVIASRLAPTGFCVVHKSMIQRRTPVGAGLPAKAVGQQHGGWMCRRHREQARSHRFYVVRCTVIHPDPLWERACSRWRCDSQ